jgi:prevent-host-death family protein
MISVTAKELKLRLGQYLQAVERGETVRVSKRGKTVAEIKPLPISSDERLAQLIREGRVTPAKRPWKYVPFEPPIVPSGPTALEILMEDRYGENWREELARDD